MSIEPVKSGLIEPAADLVQLSQYFETFQKIKAQIIKKEDIATINGKPHIKRSGWRKLATAFNVSDEIIKQDEVKDEKGVTVGWRIHVRASAPNGRFAVGIGACMVEERVKAKSQHAEHDAYAIAHTRAKNRAISDLLGSGEVSAEEIESQPQQPPQWQTFGDKKK